MHKGTGAEDEEPENIAVAPLPISPNRTGTGLKNARARINVRAKNTANVQNLDIRNY